MISLDDAKISQGFSDRLPLAQTPGIHIILVRGYVTSNSN
jgi:hypothetical protein